MSGPASALLADGRLHLQHGPIDLIISADGPPAEVASAYEAARLAFAAVLPVLAGELALLRQPLGRRKPPVTGVIARAMAAACWPYRDVFITPMAAVAGAVADHMLRAMSGAARLNRAMVNNGGDIALHLAPGQSARIAVAGRPDRPEISGRFTIRHQDASRGVATSGWRGRSFSLGIADAVTVLAATAASADAAATIIANAVNAEHPSIIRQPAQDIQIDSDLGAMMVTTAVGALPEGVIAAALKAGEATAGDLIAAGLIHGAVLQLASEIVVAGGVAAYLPAGPSERLAE